jgi:DMSO/TMAO reductase YedYZ molybdopterin-dependent catalytic subunit
MATESTRRQLLKGGLAVAGLGVLGVPEWALPALAQGETVVAFTDIPPTFNSALSAGANPSRALDIRKIDGPFTPKDQFYTTQHLGHPQVDIAAYRLKITGLVDKPRTASSARATGKAEYRVSPATRAGRVCRFANS